MNGDVTYVDWDGTTTALDEMNVGGVKMGEGVDVIVDTGEFG